MELIGNFLDNVILLAVFIYLLITVSWQWIEKKAKGENIYVFWHDVIAIIFSLVLATLMVLFQDVEFVLLVVPLIKLIAQVVTLVLIWNTVVELIGLRKINKLLKQQLESKDRQIKMLEELIEKPNH